MVRRGTKRGKPRQAAIKASFAGWENALKRAEIKRLLKLVSIAAIVIILAAVLVWYFMSSYFKGAIEDIEPTFIDKDAYLALGRIDQTSTRNGRDEWRLTADVATYHRDAAVMDLSNVKVVFYFENGNTGTLTADSGALQTDSQDFSVEKRVQAFLDDYEMTTNKLLYIKEKDTLIAETKIVITSGDSYLEADNMLLEVKNQKLFMEGHVKVYLTPEFMESPPELDIN